MNMNFDSKAQQAIYMIHRKSTIKYWLGSFIVLLLLIMFLPWTQNIKAKGYVTTLEQQYRPQKIYSTIAGQITKWYVKEGDLVKQGDTIVMLSEIKAEYLDPALIDRTQNQLSNKKEAIGYYENKILATINQINNLKESRRLKIEQLQNKYKQTNNKLAGEKAEWVAMQNETQLLKNQYERQEKMYAEGLVSQTQLQLRNVAYQNAVSKLSILENKIAQTQQELLNIGIEQNSTEQEYTEKINKAEGDNFQNQTQIANSRGDVAKLENQISNYTLRHQMYVVLAPQNGQIVQATKEGLGEIIKDGEPLCSIVPESINYAVEMYVRPMDLPLVHVGQSVRFIFDGFPAIVFSGWPESSYGTFSGKIVAFENTISENGFYRVLIAEDAHFKKWPAQLRMGAGAQGILLLNDVPIWYEVWRNINGFPPDFYEINKMKDEKG